MPDVLFYGLCAQHSFLIFTDHVHKSLYLPLVLLPDVFVYFHLEVKALGKVDPVHSFAPCTREASVLKQFSELYLSPVDVFLRRIDYEVIVLGEDGDEGGFLKLTTPGQLIDKAEQFCLVDRISFCQTGNVNDARKSNAQFLQLLEYDLPNDKPIINPIEPRNIK